MTDFPVWLPLGVAAIALVYSLVGHGGASGYLALLALTPMLPKQISFIALSINCVVAGTSFVLYRQAKHFNWKLTWPFLIGSVPLAFLGSTIALQPKVYYWLVGVTLVLAAIRLLFVRSVDDQDPVEAGIPSRIGVGAGIGLLSGMVGVGGGIFLSPVVILARWANAKTTSATSAVFIVANSVVGLIGRASQGASLPSGAGWLILAGFGGALAGSYLGAFNVPNKSLQRALALVLLFAAVKLIVK